MWKMLQAEIPDDFVIATGKAHSVQDFVIEALLAAELEPDLNRYLDYDQKMIRPSEVETLVGDYSKARKILKWEPEVNFQELVALMVENDLRIESEKN
jgi:GDPmannose 4,6-dehydratase